MKQAEFVETIGRHVRAFAVLPLRDAACALLAALGHASVDNGGALSERFDRHDAIRDIHLLLADSASRAFVAVELRDAAYAFGVLADIARGLHRVLPMPLVVIFKTGAHLSIALPPSSSPRDDDPQALEKVTMIRAIDIAAPHAAQLDALASLARNAGTSTIDVERLGKRFYRDIANWYLWARERLDPAHDEKDRATALIRLLTHVVYCWFLKEKGALNARLFDESELRATLDLSPDQTTFHDSILRREVPGLFDGTDVAFPNVLFFDRPHDADLNAAYGDTKHQHEHVRGLLRILHAYKFTLVENSPVEEELALDPELLGKVFENLLASYNDETRVTARKQTGSFYTPRPIVDYMADVSLKLVLADALKRHGSDTHEIDARLDVLFAYTQRAHAFSDQECATLSNALRGCKILDPACGSGAFPIGVLHKLMHVLRKLDPHHDDYRAKRHFIEHCLYGIDIQPLAIQISKLRMMISLLADDSAHRALPNIDGRFVTANALTDGGASFKERFDIVIGNPPYYKENDDKRRFDGLRDLPCYQGKMDVWYLFADAGLEMLKPRGVLSYIATNNWTTNAGASKLRNRIVRDATLIELIDFEDRRIFEDASIQTMIMTLRKDASCSTYRATIGRPAPDFTKQDMSTLTRFQVEMDRVALKDKPLSFNPPERLSILDRIAEAGDFRLLKSEIAQGIVPNPDRVNARNIEAIGRDVAMARGIAPGDGVFVLNERECESIDRAEHGHLKPLFEPVHIDKYHKRPTNLKIIYAKKGSFDAMRAPSIVAHLSRFKEIMENRRENRTGQLGFHHLHWPRAETFFAAGEKILAPRKCASPVFLHVEDEAYVMLSVNVIRTRRIDMRYLSAVLNSSVVRYWLRHRGHMQGANFQVDAAPLQQIPIASATHTQREVIARLVRIVQRACREASSPVESLIDACVTECYFGAQGPSLIDAAAAHLDDPHALGALASDMAQRPKSAEWLALIA